MPNPQDPNRREAEALWHIANAIGDDERAIDALTAAFARVREEGARAGVVYSMAEPPPPGQPTASYDEWQAKVDAVVARALGREKKDAD